MNTILNVWPRLFPPRPKHLDVLQVRPGYAFIVSPSRTIVLGGGYRPRQLEAMLDDDDRAWSDEGRER